MKRITLLVLLLASACGTAAPTRGERALDQVPPHVATAVAGVAGAGPRATEDDLKTFGYATADLGGLGHEVVRLASATGELTDGAAARDADGAASEAAAVLESAVALQTHASKAEGRLGGLGPLDPRLKDVRVEGIEAFSDTAAYAAAVIDTATAAMTLDLDELRDAATEAAALQGTADDLAKDYDVFDKELQRWAEANPAAAATAAARYGS